MMRIRSLSVVLLWVSLSAATEAQAPGKHSPLPYRFLLVISDQWKDPASQVIEGPGEFQVLASLLKNWALPFDIVRLDQQRLDKYHLLDRDGRPRYGTIIWDADATSVKDKGVELISSLVENHAALVVLGDTIADPEISRLAGLRYVSEYKSPDGLTFVGDHFVTRGLKGREPEFLAGAGYSTQGSKVLAEKTTVLATRGAMPFLTAREVSGGGRVAWLGCDRAAGHIQKPLLRDLLKRCLVWAQGYALYPEYQKSLILGLDDMGTSDKTYLSYWHYRTLTEDLIRKGLIEPLKRHKAVMVLNVNTGYVDRKTGRVLNPWEQRVVDEIDGQTVHDYASTKRGIDAGIKEGVFEIQSHGWTHMLPDLDSPPGPWWTAPLDGVGGLDWYNEFGDRLRKREIPAATQRFHMQRAIEYIQKDFGVVPLHLAPGGGLASRSYPNHTMRIAAEMGFGLGEAGSPVYLSRDLVVSMEPVVPIGHWAFNKTLAAAEIPWSADGPYWLGLHDRDVSLDAHSVERLLSELGEDVRYMTANEYCAYLHADVGRESAEDSSLSLAIRYDDHYCRYFHSHSSTWILHASDETRRSWTKPTAEKQRIVIPAGLGTHTVRAGLN